jgi:hypothetical protein
MLGGMKKAVARPVNKKYFSRDATLFVAQFTSSFLFFSEPRINEGGKNIFIRGKIA